MRDPVDELIDWALLEREMGERPPAPMPTGIFGALDTKWTAYKGVHRPCDACTELIHEAGVAGAPHPMPARRRRKGPNGDRFLCNDHAEQHKRLDDKVTAEKKAAEEADQRARQAAIAARTRASSRTQNPE
jgi:hypothetical protein